LESVPGATAAGHTAFVISCSGYFAKARKLFLLLSALQIFSQGEKVWVAASPAKTRPFPLPEKEPSHDLHALPKRGPRPHHRAMGGKTPEFFGIIVRTILTILEIICKQLLCP